MPFKSKAQQRWGNSPAGHKALGDAGVTEWNAATKDKGGKLPMKSTMHEYDHNRPKRQVITRHSK